MIDPVGPRPHFFAVKFYLNGGIIYVMKSSNPPVDHLDVTAPRPAMDTIPFWEWEEAEPPTQRVPGFLQDN